MPYLDDSEKRFWASCRMEDPFSREDLEEEWRHVWMVIAKRRYEAGRKQLADAMRRAQAEGDLDRVNAYLKVLNDSVWRDDGQY